jgi:hypothetical protein
MYRWCLGTLEHHLVALELCGVIHLAATGSSIGADSTYDGAYTGQRLLTEGPIAACPTEEEVSATIKGGVLTFTNSRLKKFGIGFNPDPNGSFKLININAGGGALVYDETGGGTVTIQGRIKGDVIDADVVNGPCTHHWHLVNQH